jgi:hypothetical protein
VTRYRYVSSSSLGTYLALVCPILPFRMMCTRWTCRFRNYCNPNCGVCGDRSMFVCHCIHLTHVTWGYTKFISVYDQTVWYSEVKHGDIRYLVTWPTTTLSSPWLRGYSLPTDNPTFRTYWLPVIPRIPYSRSGLSYISTIITTRTY